MASTADALHRAVKTGRKSTKTRELAYAFLRPESATSHDGEIKLYIVINRSYKVTIVKCKFEASSLPAPESKLSPFPVKIALVACVYVRVLECC